jgi:methylamine---glutamate N-methyltransferase subunit B
VASVEPVAASRQFDLSHDSLRNLNRFLHRDATQKGVLNVQVYNPDGAHSIACGLDAELEVNVHGHVGYYAAGMNKHAAVTIHGNAGPGVAENMMSGRVHVKGFASTAAGASAHGGLLIIDGDASLRCGISLKGADIVVGGSVGSFSAFMAQAGRIVVCGDAGDALGDSLYEAVIYVRGTVRSLGADARVEPMSDADLNAVSSLLTEAELPYPANTFKRIASSKSLYHWHAEADQEY